MGWKGRVVKNDKNSVNAIEGKKESPPAEEEAYLFILSPPFSGSTILHHIISTSPAVSHLPDEGQHLKGATDLMRGNHWVPSRDVDWNQVRAIWEDHWNGEGPIFLEKSPPNLLRADKLEEHFQPASFIVMMSDPYSFVESIRRRPNYYGVVRGAKLWLRIAEYQRKNIEELERATSFLYRELTNETERVLSQILEFKPELKRLEPGRVVGHSSAGEQPGIANLNPVHIRRLGGRNIHRINTVLRERPDLMEYFDYRYIQPSIVQTLDSVVAWGETYLLRLLRYKDLVPESFRRRVERYVQREMWKD